MAIIEDLKTLLHPYYIVNIIFSLSFLTLKTLTPFCHILFPESGCELDMRESEILFFLLVIVMIRSRKTGSMSMISYLTSGFIYAKLANLLLWFYSDPRYGLLYGVLFVMQGLMFPEPIYTGPENVVYFQDSGVDEELQRDKQKVWLLAFFAAWSPTCVSFAPVFSRISAEYSLENLKFGKLDVGRYPDVARKYFISDSSFSKQLPTLILFKDGKEVLRRPDLDSRGRFQKFIFTEDNIKAAYDLNNIYKLCKSQLTKKKKKRSPEIMHLEMDDNDHLNS